MSQPCGCTSRVGAISFMRCLHLCSDFYQTTDLDSRLSTFAQQNVESRHNNWSQVEQRTITRDYTAHRSATSATGYKMLEGVSGTPAGNSV